MHNYLFNIKSENLWCFGYFHDLQHSKEDTTTNLPSTNICIEYKIRFPLISPDCYDSHHPADNITRSAITKLNYIPEQKLMTVYGKVYDYLPVCDHKFSITTLSHNLQCVLVVKMNFDIFDSNLYFLFSARVTGCPFWPCQQISQLIYMWLSNPQRVLCPHLPFLS